MIEIAIAVGSVVIGLLIGIGWYKRGFCDMEKRMDAIEQRVDDIEGTLGKTYTDLEVIKTRMMYMETKLDEIHTLLMSSVNRKSFNEPE